MSARPWASALVAVAWVLACACADDTGASVVVSVSNVPAGVTALDVSIAGELFEATRTFDDAAARAALADGEATFAVAIERDTPGDVAVAVGARVGACTVARASGACSIGACTELALTLDALAEPVCDAAGADAGPVDAGPDNGRADR